MSWLYLSSAVHLSFRFAGYPLRVADYQLQGEESEPAAIPKPAVHGVALFWPTTGLRSTIVDDCRVALLLVDTTGGGCMWPSQPAARTREDDASCQS